MTAPLPPSANPDSNSEIVVPVNLGPRSYDVRVVSQGSAAVGPFVREALDRSWAGRACRRALIVTDQNVAPHHTPISSALTSIGITPTLSILPPGESTKSLDHAADLYEELIRIRADRHTCVIALGGGVIGDLAGFVAATYARGLPLLMIPTSLLAMVDSSVGGKVGVNHPRAKNIIGAFHQPAGVWIETELLATLSDRELRCGLAEVIKYGVILDAAFFEFLEQNAEAILNRDPGALRHVIAHSCRLKADVVSKDEREETGCRAILNFGHTFGHAVEAVAGYNAQFHHGEAVAVGMIGGCRLAERLGWIGSDLTARLFNLVRRFGLPTVAQGLNTQALLDAMTRDKKNQMGKIRFILPRRLGLVELTDQATEQDVREVLESVVNGVS